MAIEVFNRFERKYLLDIKTCQSVLKGLERHMEPDPYNKDGKVYTISNIYYDTPDNILIRKSLEKPDYKEKLRLRSYGTPDRKDKAFLEIKKKVCGVVNKRRTKILLEDAYEFLRTGTTPAPQPFMNQQVANEIAYFLKRYALEPKLYLAYDRRAYFEKGNSDLRISFDTNIRTRRTHLFLEYGDSGDILLPADKWLMEIKTEKAIPLWLSELLSEMKLYSTGFSKYGTEYQLYIANQTGREDVSCLTSYLAKPLTVRHYPLAAHC